MDNQTNNPIDQLENDTLNVGGSVASEATGSAKQEVNVEVDTLQANVQETEAEDAPLTPPVVSTVPPMPPTPIRQVPQMAQLTRPVELSEQDFRIVANKRREDTAKRLMAQPKVMFMVPKTPGEADGLAYEAVTIDGLRSEIRKGVMVEVPRQIAEILAEKYRIELSAGSHKRIDGSQDKLNALS
jgi:hypothetical protein